MGVMVDSVSRVTDWTREDIERSPAFGTQVRVDCLLGMGKLGEKFVPILDINRVLSADELLTAAAAPSIDAGGTESEDSKDEQGERGRLEKAAEDVGNRGAVDTGATG
jgi:purine-binding chemotaxis protein CheW